MSDFDIIRALRQNDERYRLTEVKETPGVPPNFSSFYDSGTFTPSYQGTGTAGTWAYNIQTGFYTRIGNRCLFSLSVQVASRSVAPTGDARIIGLPFTSVATANSHSPVVLDTLDSLTLTAGITQLTARIPPSAAYIEFVEVRNVAPTATNLLAATGLGTASTIRVSGHYQVA